MRYFDFSGIVTSADSVVEVSIQFDTEEEHARWVDYEKTHDAVWASHEARTENVVWYVAQVSWRHGPSHKSLRRGKVVLRNIWWGKR